MAPPRRKQNHRRQQKQEQGRQQPGPEEKDVESKKACALLKLPAELRNIIYELALTDENGAQLVHWPEHVKNLDARRTAVPGPEAKRAKDIVLSTHPLTQVNKKIRSEVLPMAIMMAPVLKFTVHGFDFTRLMSLFDHYWVNDPNYRNVDVGWLPVDIEFVFSDSYNIPSRSEHPGLHEWLLRVSDEDRRNAYSHVPRYSVHQPIKFAMRDKFELVDSDMCICPWHVGAAYQGIYQGPKEQLELRIESVARSLSWPSLEDAASWGWKRPSPAEIKAEAFRLYQNRT